MTKNPVEQEGYTMNHISSMIENLSIGEAVSHEGLMVYRLLRKEPFAKDYQTLDEALAAGTATITEVSDSGSVPELLFRNKGEQAVFLLDGEELVGAKQNRILNITLLAPAMKDTVIPVSCVEAGRWSHTSPDFKTAPRAQFAASRAKRSAQVSDDIARFKRRRSNQGEVWDDVACKLDSLGSQSATQAVESAFEDNQSKLDSFVKKLGHIESQSGGIFCINGRITGMELFDSQETCRALMPKIIRSYALDAIDPRYAKAPQAGQPSPREFLKRIGQAKYHEAEAVGEGTDLRIQTGSGLSGGALYARDRIVHLVVFALQEQTMHSSDRVYRRRAF
jgi:hypothetical protein